MTTKKERLTDEELLAQFEDIGVVDGPATTIPNAATSDQPSEADLFEELGIPERPKAASRPHTPHLASKSATPALRSSPKRSATATPPEAARSSDDKAQLRRSGDSTRSFHTSFTPATEAEGEAESEKDTKPEPTPKPAPSSGGSWWGGILSTATAAVKQAEALAKEIKQNEEAQRWAEQVKGNVGALRGLGDELRSRALPTFTNILHTLAPPISSHERLQIHITHDFVGYPSLDPLIYNTFSRVMAQVEGGELLVIQRGRESSLRRDPHADGYGTASGMNSGWSDGPWWRQPSDQTRGLGAVKGLVEGTKLSRVSAETYATEYLAARGGLEEAAKQATEVLSESNPVRSSDIFLAIQAISHPAPADLFGEPAAPQSDSGAVEPETAPDNLICFAVYLHDPVHGISYSTLSQTLPEKWITWLDASSHPSSSPDPEYPARAYLPDEIAEIVESGGVDPREWVAEWVEEILVLGVGVVAQRYVARRMGVGEGGIGRGKARQQALESGGSEAARAV
jgi:hypothetical protein